MTTPPAPSRYGELVQQQANRHRNRSAPTPEDELDSLIGALKERQQGPKPSDHPKPDPIQELRDAMMGTYIPIFVELVEKYSDTGISMQMDASNLLEGGREIRFEFGIADHRIQLLGTVTTEAIAFHETRFSPEVHGELVSGPMLRLRGLNGELFRGFVCERLSALVRAVSRRR